MAEFRPERVAIADASRAGDLRRPGRPPARRRRSTSRPGPTSLAAIARDADVVVNGVVGFAGLTVTLAALRAGHRLALATHRYIIQYDPPLGGKLEEAVAEEEDVFSQSLMEKAGLEKPKDRRDDRD